MKTRNQVPPLRQRVIALILSLWLLPSLSPIPLAALTPPQSISPNAFTGNRTGSLSNVRGNSQDRQAYAASMAVGIGEDLVSLFPLKEMPDVQPNRRLPDVEPRTQTPFFSEKPSRKEIFDAKLLPAPLLPVAGREQDGDNLRASQFLKGISADRNNIKKPEQLLQRMEKFVQSAPDNAYTPSVRANLAKQYFMAGYFSKAVDTWRISWQELKDETAPESKALADEVLGQYARMLGRVGRMEELGALLHSVRDRVVTGAASEYLASSREGLWSMQNDPGTSFICGPLALLNCYKRVGLDTSADGFRNIQAMRSTSEGISLETLIKAAENANMNYMAVKREPGAKIPDSFFPMVVHWNLDHYGCLIGRDGDRIKLTDPTFLTDIALTEAALDQEASGYMLVPKGKLPRGWRAVSYKEATDIYGRGNPGQKDKDDCEEAGGDGLCGSGGMATYAFTPLLIGLRIRDIPIGYSPPVGEPVSFMVTYNQRDDNQPANFSYTNLGSKWTFNYTAYIEDDATAATANVIKYQNGIREDFSGYDSISGAYDYSVETRLLLEKVSSSPIKYQLTLPNGATMVFEDSDGTIGTGRKVFLSERSDPMGNTQHFSYDAQMRLVAITDQLGQVSTLSYEHPDDPLKLTKITDPFSRSATFKYDAQSRLSEITDVLGLTSSFAYDQGDFINAMTTPYGRTTFEYGEEGPRRWLVATDPYGDRERIEFRNHDVVNDDRDFPIPDAATVAPTNFSAPNISNEYLSERNTYYWDKKMIREAEKAGYTPEDGAFYEMAEITHWLHRGVLHGPITPIAGSRKMPLERREWYTYPGQSNDAVADSGMLGLPKQIGRVLDDGSNYTLQYSYNNQGKVTEMTDPEGRNFTFVYAANGIDLLEIRQTYGSNNELIQQYANYNSQHLPQTITDGAGETTTINYTTQGQPALITNPLGEKTRYTYDKDLDGIADSEGGYLIKVERTDPNNATLFVTTSEFTYTSNGNLATTTDSSGYSLEYTFDVFDRLTQVEYPDATTEKFFYDRLDLAGSQDRENRQSRIFRDALRRVVAEVDPLGRVTNYKWCLCGSLSSLTDANGNVTRWKRDVQGRVTEKIFADGNAYGFTYYNAFSRLQMRTDSLNQVTTYGYTKDGNVDSIAYTNEVNATPDVTFSYAQDFNRLTQMTDGNGITTYDYHPYDGATHGAGNLSQVNGSLNADIIEYSYDALGRLESRAVNHIVSSLDYDSLGRATSVTNPLGSFTRSYVGNTARLSSVAYPNGQDTNYSYHPAVGDFRLKTIDNRDAANSILSKFDYQYSPTGNITRGDQVLGSIRSENRAYDYDRADQLIGSTYLNPTTQTVLKQFGYAFDLIGNRLSETIHTPSVNETIWSEEFTGQNGKGGFVSSGVETTDTAGVDWSVDLANVDLANDASGDWFQVKDEVFEGVDLDGEAVWLSPNIDISDHSNIAFTLDTAEDGSLESSDYLHVIYSTDGGTNFTDINNWNTQGDSTHSLVDDWTSETITVDNLSGSAFQLRVAMQNNANTEKIRLDNVAVTGDSQPETLVTEASFNNLNQLISLTGGGKLVFSGNTDEPATVTLEGAPAQLSAGGEHFSANLNLPSGLNTVTIEATDVNSNTTTQDYEVDVTPGASRAVSYDANGNMTNNGAGQTFAWDAENRLIKITRGTETTEFTFDGNGRRVRIIEKDNSIQTANNWYVWDGAQIVEKRNETGGSWRRRYYGQGFVDSSDGKLFYTKDHLGSIREVVADDGTTVEAVYDYSPWGEVTKIGGSGLESDFLYTGHFYHDESDLHLTLYRAYNPELGMWLSRDPIAENGGLNLYAYVGNNPIMDWDPLGLEVSCTYDKSDGTVSMRDADTGATVTYPAESGGKPFGDSIPNGNYEILERKGRPGFYRLDPIDSVTRDDTHQPTGRDHFRLHGPGRTTGCVAAKNEDEWQDAKQLLDSTKTKTVEDYYGGKPSGPIERYGFIRVVD